MTGSARKRTGSFLATLLSLVLFSCGGNGGGSGILQVNITDLPSTAYNSVTLTITQINLITESGEFGVVNLENPLSVNVLDYADHSLRLGQGTIPANAYQQLRLVLEENPPSGEPLNYVTLNCTELPAEMNCDPDQKWPMKTPSGHTSGLKVSLPNDLEITDGGIAQLTIDFAPDTAIVERGDWDPLRHDNKERFLIKPTGIRIIYNAVQESFGVLFGNVSFIDVPDSGPLAVVTAIDTLSQMPAAATLVAPDDGTEDFRFFLDAGNYDVRVKADGYQTLIDGPFAVAASASPPHPETDAGNFTLEPVVPAP